MKKQRGITLIALVITIIVLLILAGVSISAVIGENGIATKAKLAKEEMKFTQIKEQLELYILEKEIAETTGDTYKTIEEFVEELENNGTITSEEKEIILTEHELTIGSQETIFFPFSKTLVQAFKDGDIKIGDYIEYIPSNLDATVKLEEFDTGYTETQTYSVDENTTWRVLGLNEDKTELLIISGSPIKKDGEYPYLIMGGAESWYNGINTLDKISKLYHNSKLASETRSINVEDINNALGLIVDEGNVIYLESDETKSDLNYQNIINKTNPNYFGESYTYKQGDYALENYLKAQYPNDEKIQTLITKKIGDTVKTTQYAYYITDIIDETNPLYDVLFNDTTKEVNYAKRYWLATVGMCNQRGMFFAGPGCVMDSIIGTGSVLFNQNGMRVFSNQAVRPIISIKSNITIEQMPIITGSEVEWNTEMKNIPSNNMNKGQVVEVSE